MRTAPAAALVLAAATPLAAQFCKPQDLAGAYGFQLSGTANISGAPQPVASIGRLEFNGHGVLSGTASVNFNGFFLGNPVTGSYEAHQDCTITWSLQDDSGAMQHFTGTLTPDLLRATFRQTDSGGARNGLLAKVADECSATALQGAYSFTVSGNVIPMKPGETARRVSLQGVLTADAAGNAYLLRDGVSNPAGTVTVDSDCIVEMDLTPIAGAPLKLRGVLVDSGKEILAIETDPGATVTARFQVR